MLEAKIPQPRFKFPTQFPKLRRLPRPGLSNQLIKAFIPESPKKSTKELKEAPFT